MTVETNNDKIIMEDLVKTLDNICELYEKQADASDIQQCIRDARTLLNSIHSDDASEPTYIDTVLTDIQKCSIL